MPHFKIIFDNRCKLAKINDALCDGWFAYTLFIIQQIFTKSIDNTKKMVKT